MYRSTRTNGSLAKTSLLSRRKIYLKATMNKFLLKRSLWVAMKSFQSYFGEENIRTNIMPSTVNLFQDSVRACLEPN